jgi:hypothetical protein
MKGSKLTKVQPHNAPVNENFLGLLKDGEYWYFDTIRLSSDGTVHVLNYNCEATTASDLDTVYEELYVVEEDE